MRHGSIKYLVFKRIVCTGNLFLFICTERQPPLEQLHLSAVDAVVLLVTARVRRVTNSLRISYVTVT